MTAARRSVFGLTLISMGGKTDPNGPRKLKQVKTNMGRRPGPLKVEFAEISKCAANLTYAPLDQDADAQAARGSFCQSWLIETLRDAGARSVRSGKDISSHCPLRRGDNPTAFHLYKGKGGEWRWRCFTRWTNGQNDGNAVTFYIRWQGVRYETALEELARRARPGNGFALRDPSENKGRGSGDASTKGHPGDSTCENGHP